MDKRVKADQPADKILILEWRENSAVAIAWQQCNSWLRWDEGLALPVRVLDSEVPLRTTSELLTVSRMMVSVERPSEGACLVVEGFLAESESLFDVRRPTSTARKCSVQVLEDGSGWLWFDESPEGGKSSS